MLQFKINDLSNKDNILNEIEKLFVRNVPQESINETFRSNAKPILMLIAGAGR